MSKHWSSIKKLKKHYKIVEADQEILLKILKEKRNELHPDKTGGEFQNDSEKNKYLDLKEAIKFVKSEINESQQLVPISQLSTLIKTISTELSLKTEPSIVEVQKNLKTEFRAELSHKYKGFKIGSGILAGISAYLFTQASTLADHPILREFFGTRDGIIGITVMFFIFSMSFLVTWIREKQEESTVNYLLTDDASRMVYKNLQETGKQFSIRQIENTLSYIRSSDYEQSHRNHVNPMILNKIAKLQISKFLEKDLIAVVDKKGFDEVYALK